jgi:hypothetical protein
VKAINSLFGLILLELSFVLVLVIFWAGNKGFDFTDESYYILSLSQPEESPGIFYFQHILDFFFGWMQPGLVGFRFMRLFLSLLASLILASGLRIWKRTVLPGVGIIPDKYIYYFALSFLSIATSYSLFPQALSYNNITVIFLAFSMGILLYFHAYSLSNVSGKMEHMSFLFGVAAVLVFFGRFTSGLLMLVFLPIFSFLILLLGRQSWRVWAKHWIWYGAGILVSLIISSLMFKSLVDWFAEFFKALAAVSGHSTNDILTTHFDSVNLMLTALIENHAVIPFILLVWINGKTTLGKIPHIGPAIFMVGSLGLLTWLGKDLYESSLHLSGSAYMSEAIYFYLSLLLAALALVLNRPTISALMRFNAKNTGVVLLLVSLFVFPFIGSVGTDNALNFQLLQFTFAWIMLLFILVSYAFLKVDKVLALGLALILVAGSFSQTVNGLVFNPYRIPGTLRTQKQDVLLKSGDRLLLDEMTASNILNYEKLINSLKGYKEGDPMIVLSGTPGFVYLANAGVVSNAWMKIGYNESICYNLNTSKREDLDRLIIVAPTSAVIEQDLISCMKERNVLFPENYLMGESFNYTFFNLNLTMYVPKHVDN